MKAEETEVRQWAVAYFEGRISGAEEKLLFDYIEQSAAHRSAFRLWEKEWIAVGVPDSRTEAEWKSMQRKIRTYKAILPMLSARPVFLRKIAAIAAIVILTIGSTVGIREAVSVWRPATYFTCEALYGEKSKMVLSDGTVVWLNSGSTLEYSDKFDTHNRKVTLSGEGYFEVAKKDGATFIVQTHGYDVIVRGTKFNVSAYPDDPFISTTLLEGVVELEYQGRQIKMSPGESLRLDLASGRFTCSHVNALQAKAWAENRIEFDDVTLKELVARLSRQYDVNICLDSEEVGQKKFRISLRNRETIGEVMTALQKIIPISVERKGKDIYIRE